jgi:glutaredoxin 3
MKKVKIYSTPTCPHCLAAKAFLKEKGVKFEIIDVSANQKAADEMVKKTGQVGVPVIDIGGKIVVGFDKAKIESLL